MILLLWSRFCCRQKRRNWYAWNDELINGSMKWFVGLYSPPWALWIKTYCILISAGENLFPLRYQQRKLCLAKWESIHRFDKVQKTKTSCLRSTSLPVILDDLSNRIFHILWHKVILKEKKLWNNLKMMIPRYLRHRSDARDECCCWHLSSMFQEYTVWEWEVDSSLLQNGLLRLQLYKRFDLNGEKRDSPLWKLFEKW